MSKSVSDIFKDDFNWMQRERKGLYPWVAHNYWQAFRYINYEFCDFHCFHRDRISDNKLISLLLNHQFLENQLFDILQKAIMRAELRLLERYIPQKSNEERLTGHLVSEIDSALFLIKPFIKNTSLKLYNEKKEIDFFYYDLSKGGKVENRTGADLGFIIVVDLPDFPYTVQSVVLQAKKSRPDGRIQIDIKQLNKIRSITNNAAYLFYDMDLERLSSPMIIGTHLWENKLKEAEEKGENSFSIDMGEILTDGIPLSLYILDKVIERRKTDNFNSLGVALSSFREATNEMLFDGPLAIVSLGKPISYSFNTDGFFLSVD